MKQKSALILIMTMRLCGLAALVLGCLYSAAHSIPLPCHLVVGAVAVASLLGLSLLGFRHTPMLATIAATVALGVPVLGLAQQSSGLGDSHLHALFTALHFVCGLAAIALAEIVAKRIRSPRPTGA